MQTTISLVDLILEFTACRKQTLKWPQQDLPITVPITAPNQEKNVTQSSKGHGKFQLQFQKIILEYGSLAKKGTRAEMQGGPCLTYMLRLMLH